MTEEEKKLQRLGTNDEAQGILTTQITAAFPELEQKYSLSETIKETFYDWYFAHEYKTGGEGSRFWTAQVKAIIRRFAKLKELDTLFDEVAGASDGSFKETWSGTDTDTFEDNRAEHSVEKSTINPATTDSEFTDSLMRQTQTRYNGVGVTTSQNLGELVVDSPTEGKNSQKTVTTVTHDGDDVKDTTKEFAEGKNNTVTKREKGTSREYSDGRTAAQRLTDAAEIAPPIEEFINAFSLALLCPYNVCEDCGLGWGWFY